MKGIEKQLGTKDPQQLLHRRIKKTESRKCGIKWTTGISEHTAWGD